MTARLLTTTGISVETRVCAQTIRKWVDRGWVTCERDSSGRRIFTEAAVKKVNQLRAERCVGA